MVKDQDLSKDVMINPRDPQRMPGYVYIKQPPEKERTHSDERVVIYEAHDPGAKQIAVGFADGHVEGVSEDRLQKLLEANK
jgi:prepilin-type processing-associated H-X9-DG protein